jgi:phosphatidylethanolamine/phosphatidyl-N-methylethanolamine N-methyltransferase
MSLRTFAAEVLTDFTTIAAIAPSSSHLASAMLEPLPLARVSTVVELGAGTGAITRALLEELPQHATLLAFEINPRFIDYLQRNFTDPRLVVVNSSAEVLDSELRRRGIDRVDAVVSSLGLGFMSERQRHGLFRRLQPFLHEKTVFTQYQYIHAMQFGDGRLRRLSLRPLLGQYFGSVQSKTIWRNLPPAFVFTCRPKATAIRT